MSLSRSQQDGSSVNEFVNIRNVTVPQLGGDDYSSWKIKVHELMISLNLHGVYDRQVKNFKVKKDKVMKENYDSIEAKLDAMDNEIEEVNDDNKEETKGNTNINSITSTVTAEASSLSLSLSEMSSGRIDPAIKKLFEDMNKAWSLLMRALTVDMREQVKLLEEGYPHAVMEYLRSKYENDDLVNIGDLWIKYLSMKMNDDELFDKYRARLEEAKSRLTSAKRKQLIPPDLHQMLITDKLPDKFKLVIITMKTSKDYYSQSTDWICTQINNFERELNRTQVDQPSIEQTFYTASAGNKSSGSSSQAGKLNATPNCNFCKQSGHVRHECKLSIAANEKDGKCGHCGSFEHKSPDHGEWWQKIGKHNYNNRYNRFKKPQQKETGTAYSAVETNNEIDPEYMFASIAIDKLPLVTTPTKPGDPTGKTTTTRGDGIAVKELLKTNSTFSSKPYVSKNSKTATQILSEGGWVIDSGASVHVTGNKKIMKNIKTTVEVSIKLGDDAVITTNQCGDVVVPMLALSGKVYNVTIENVYFNERFKVNLLSLGTLQIQKWGFTSIVGLATLTSPSGNEFKLNSSSKIFLLELAKKTEHVYTTTVSTDTKVNQLINLHNKLNHMGFDQLLKTIELNKTEKLTGKVKLLLDKEVIELAKIKIINCTACIAGKGTKVASGHRGLEIGKSIGEVIHTDSYVVKTQVNPNDKSSKITVETGLVMADVYSGGKWHKKVKTKDEIPDALIKILSSIQASTGRKVRILNCDGGTEFINVTLRKWCEANGTQIMYTPTNTPVLNSVAERMVRSVKDAARTLLIQCGLPRKFWHYAIDHYVNVWNRTTISPYTGVTPYESLTKTQPSLLYHAVFGCNAYYFVEKSNRKTFDPKMEPGIYLGQSKDQHGAIIYKLDTNTAIVTKNVKYKENVFSFANGLSKNKIGEALVNDVSIIINSDELEVNNISEIEADNNNDNNKMIIDEEIDAGLIDETNNNYVVPPIIPPDIQRNRQVPTPSGRVLRSIIKPTDFGPLLRNYYSALVEGEFNEEQPMEHVYAASTVLNDSKPKIEPTSYNEAINGNHGLYWKEACDDEFNSLMDNNTWTLAPRPTDDIVIPGQWVLKIKTDDNGLFSKCKARWVLKGFKQVSGRHFDPEGIFAPTLKYKSNKVLLSLVAGWDYELVQMDVKTAFLNAFIQEKIYMEQPTGYSNGEKNTVCLLIKTLYGSHQAPAEWFILICDVIMKVLGFTRCTTEICFFFKISRTGRLILMIIFVDDAQVAFHKNDFEEWKELEALYCAQFETKLMGDSVWMLGMKITRDRIRHTIKLDQEQYIKSKLELFGLTNCNSVPTPMVSTNKLELDSINNNTTTDQQLTTAADSQLYMEMVGSLLYAAICTRIDISSAVRILTKYMKNPTKQHIIAAKHSFRYLHGTTSLGLLFHGTPNLDMIITCYTDSDWANDKTDRHSITGWIVKLNGDIISYSSKKQVCVATSSSEAELYAEASAIKEVIWLKGLLKELGLNVQMNVIVFCDNQSTIAISNNGLTSERTKHIDISYKFIKQYITSGLIKPTWISTDNQQADILTKQLTTPLFIKFRKLLMVE
jgi:hypothetical protein